MSGLEAWLAARTPAPPPALARALGEVEGAEGGAPLEALATGALATLDRARARPGRVRGSAYLLLVADALLTYACEAALEIDDPDTALLDLIDRAAAGERR